MKNVIILLIDTLRVDCIKGYPIKSYVTDTSYNTPTMSSIAEHGQVFSKCWSTHPYTSGACGSLATGLFPYHIGNAFTYIDTKLPNHIDTIAQILQKHNITTKHHFDFKPFSNLYGLDQGVDEVTYWDTEKDVDILKWVSAQEKDFYLLWHFGDVHAPYYQSWDSLDDNQFYKDFLTQNRDKYFPDYILDDLHTYWNFAVDVLEPYLKKYNLQSIIKWYTDSVHRFDTGRLARIWSQLKNLENTLVILVADHGEQFIDGIPTHGYTLDEELLHVPLILHHKDISHSVNDNLVRLVDIPATVLDFYNIKTQLDGVSLFNDTPNLQGYAERLIPFMCPYPNDRVHITEQAIRSGDRKYLIGDRASGSYMIQDLTETKSDHWDDLEKSMDEIKHNTFIEMDQKDVREIDDIMGKMKELGYV